MFSITDLDFVLCDRTRMWEIGCLGLCSQIEQFYFYLVLWVTIKIQKICWILLRLLKRRL